MRKTITTLGLTLLFSLFFVSLSAQTTVKINPQDTQQEIEGWGASLCWWAHMIGQWDDEEKIDAIIDSIVSPDKLNMNVFRYNIGGGDDPSHYTTPDKPGHMVSGKGFRAEMEGFKPTENAEYDWSADAGQRNVMLKIKEKRPDVIFEAFSNSPPYWMTYSGCSSGNESANSDNLKPEYYDAFCDYLIDVCKHYKETYGIEFRTLEPFNEPLTNYWGAMGGQEGCHFGVKSQMEIIRKLYPKLQASGLNTVISASDETSLGYTKTALNAYINEGDILDKIGQINTHTYSGSDKERKEVLNLVRQTGKPFWQSETGPMGMSGSAFEINLQLAKLLFRDMNIMKPDAWLDWQMMEEGNDTWCQFRGSFSEETYHVVKNYYVRMQVTRFFKQGYRILSSSDQSNVLMAISPNNDEVVLALVNNSGAEKAFNIDLSSFYTAEGEARLFRTSTDENCKELNSVAIKDKSISYAAPDLSITTIIIPVKAIDYKKFDILNGIGFENSQMPGFSGESLKVGDNVDKNGINNTSKVLSADLTNAVLSYSLGSTFVPTADFRYLHVMVYSPQGNVSEGKGEAGEVVVSLPVSAGWQDVVIDLASYKELDKISFSGKGIFCIDNLVINGRPGKREIAENAPVFNFETPEGTPDYSFENTKNLAVTGIVINNPDYGGLNPLGKIFECLLPPVADASKAESAFVISLPSPFKISEDTRYMHFMIKSPAEKVDVQVNSLSQSLTIPKNQWVDLVLDLNSITGELIREMKISPYGRINLNSLVYIDNIVFNKNSSPKEYVYSAPGTNPYVIVSRHSGLAIVESEDGIIQTQVDMSFQDKAQQWLFSPNGRGYVITNVLSGKSLFDNGSYFLASQERGEEVSGYVYAVAESENSYVRINSLASNKALDVDNASTEVGAKIGLWTYGTSDNIHRQWALLEVKGDTETSIREQECKPSPLLYTINGGLFLAEAEAGSVYEVYDMAGMLLKSGIVDSDPLNVMQASGIFLVRVKTGDINYSLKGVSF